MRLTLVPHANDINVAAILDMIRALWSERSDMMMVWIFASLVNHSGWLGKYGRWKQIIQLSEETEKA
jgi:hypothetical protein